MNAGTGRALVAAIGLWTFQACDGDSPVERTPQVTQLAFIRQPATAEGQVAFEPAIRVALQDASGRTVTGASREVTVRLGASPAGATLRGTTTVTSVNGVATFADLSLALPGDGFRLEAQSPGLPAVLSNPFVVRLTFAETGAGS